MEPIKSQRNGRIIETLQWMGLVFLIGFAYRHFGPEASTPITPLVIAIFGVGTFMLLGPIQLKSKG